MLTLVLMLLSQNGCQPGGNCQAASFYPTCTATSAFPTCNTSQRGRIRCALSDFDGGGNPCQAFCNGTSWGCVGSGGSGGTTYTGTAPIDVTGSVISCIAASGVVGGCVTTAGQTFAGAKAFTSAVDLQAGAVVRGDLLFINPTGGVFQCLDPNQGFRFAGNSSTTSTDPDFQIESTLVRKGSDKPLLTVYNGAAHAYRPFTVTADGRVRSGLAPNPDGGPVDVNGGFTVDNPGNGSADYDVSEGNYLTIMGRVPRKFAALHAATNVENSNGMEAGYLFGVINPITPGGNILDNKFYINYRGSITPIQEDVSTFEPCGNYDVLPTDGGTEATDAGVALGGSLRWGNDARRWYTCISDAGTSGSWSALALKDENIGNLSGFMAGQALVAANDNIVIGNQRMYAAVTWVRLGYAATLPGTNGGGTNTYTMEIYNNTMSTPICVSSAIACNTASIGSLDCGDVTSDTFADIRLRFHCSGCATCPMVQVNAEYR